MTEFDVVILGQGLAGSALAWQQHWRGLHVLIIDRADQRSASHVAAGLMTPVTGRRMTKAPDFDARLADATAFYRRVESETGGSLFEQQ